MTVHTHGVESIKAKVSPPLFDWVIENLLKNALDAMEGKGSIDVDIRRNKGEVQIDVADTGKGISAKISTAYSNPDLLPRKEGGDWALA